MQKQDSCCRSIQPTEYESWHSWERMSGFLEGLYFIMKSCDHIWCHLRIDSCVEIYDPWHSRQMKQMMTNQLMEKFMSTVRPKKVHKNWPVWHKLPLRKLKIWTPLNKPLLALLQSQTQLDRGDKLWQPKSWIFEKYVKGQFKWILLSILSVISHKYVPL